jgi:hypothetical protein
MNRLCCWVAGGGTLAARFVIDARLRLATLRLLGVMLRLNDARVPAVTARKYRLAVRHETNVVVVAKVVK